METFLSFFTENFWATASIIVAMTTALTEVINSKLNPNRIWKQVIAWIVSIILTVGGYFLGYVTVVEPTWLTLTVTGLIVGLASNGFYDIPAIRQIVEKLFDFWK